MVPATVEFTVRLVRHPKSFGVRCTRRTGYTCAKGTHFPKLTGYGRYLPSIFPPPLWASEPTRRNRIAYWAARRAVSGGSGWSAPKDARRDCACAAMSVWRWSRAAASCLTSLSFRRHCRYMFRSTDIW